MRVFACEYVTGGGLCGQPLPASLQREGDWMLAALVKDLAAVPGVRVISTRDARLPPADLPARIETIAEPGAVWSSWRRLAAEADALWPIAPESGGALERLSRLALEQGALLLGCAPEAVSLTASKRRTAEHLAARGVPVILTSPAAAAPPSSAHGWVVKPDDGAGCEGTWLAEDRAALRSRLAALEAARAHVVQPYLPGLATSLSLLCAGGRARLLSCNLQTVAIEQGQFRYLGGVVGGASHRRAAYEALAARIASAIPGLWGYVGVDLVEADDGPRVVEVNPRLTTSYVGLRAFLGVNPAALVLDLLRGDDAPLGPILGRAPVEITLNRDRA